MTPYENLRIAIWVFGLPIIVALLVQAIRRGRAIRRRHEELLAEAQRNPQDPYQALAELYAEPEERKSGKRS